MIRTIKLTLLVALALTASVAAQEITRKYDRFKDRTTVMTKPVAQSGVDGGLFMMAGYSMPGDQQPQDQPLISLFISTKGRESSRPTEATEVIFLTPAGRRSWQAKEIKLSEVSCRQNPCLYDDTLTLEFPAAEFREVFSGADLEMQIGAREYKIKAKDVAKLRAILTRRA